jgi:peptidoglycan/LPS O-acetylase OafA/YrhL
VPPKANNFDVLRLAAAIAVILSHSYAVVGLREPTPWINPLGLAWGDLAVLVFFSISGYLITMSWDKDPSIRRYLAKRGLRILPGLIAAATFTSIVIGAFATSLPLFRYFTSANTYLYPVTTGLIFAPSAHPHGLFTGNPRGDINASLWTIPVEVLCYLLLIVLVLARLRSTAVLAPIVLLIAVAGNPHLGNVQHRLIAAGVPTVSVGGAPLSVNMILLLGAAFFAASLLYSNRDRVHFNPWMALLVMGVVIASRLTPLGPTIGVIAIPYVVLTLALTCRPLPMGPLRGWDLSYGVYLLAFPIQQLLTQLTGTRDPWALSALTLIAVLPSAALSWCLIERPSLAYKPKAVRERVEPTQPISYESQQHQGYL